METTIETGPGWELRLGRWQDVLQDVKPDAVIMDPPYSDRTHTGFRTDKGGDGPQAPGMGYGSITPDSAREIINRWQGCPGWFVVFGDHLTWRWFESAALEAGRYTFPPVAWVKTGAAPRMTGDGPGSHVEYIMVARPRAKRFLSWGALPGWYQAATVRSAIEKQGVTGSKPSDLMRALVRHYSKLGDLICDPCAGGGTTLLAAVVEGRRAIGAEVDPETFAKAVSRLRRGYTPDLFLGAGGA